MGIEYLKWEYSGTHNGNVTEHIMGIQYLRWEYSRTHNGNRVFKMGIQRNT